MKVATHKTNIYPAGIHWSWVCACRRFSEGYNSPEIAHQHGETHARLAVEERYAHLEYRPNPLKQRRGW